MHINTGARASIKSQLGYEHLKHPAKGTGVSVESCLTVTYMCDRDQPNWAEIHEVDFETDRKIDRYRYISPVLYILDQYIYVYVCTYAYKIH